MARIQLNPQIQGKSRIKASGMIEVIVSMVVIVVIFCIAMGIVTNVQRLSLSAKRIKAEATLKHVLITIEHTTQAGNANSNASTNANTHTNTTIKIDDFNITEEISNYKQSKDLLLVSLTAFDVNQEKVAELHKLIRP